MTAHVKAPSPRRTPRFGSARVLLVVTVGWGLPVIGPASPGLPAEKAFTGTTTTIAGGSFGDGLDALRASIDYPWGIALGPDGDLYIADTFHHQIRVVGQDGVIRRVAGTTEGYGGDDGPALAARLNRPAGLEFDPNGRLLVADAGNNRVRRIDLSTGTITTIAGTGKRYSDAGDGGNARYANLSFPTDVAVGRDGSVYIADTENHKVRRVAPNGTITTYAGTADRCHPDGEPTPLHCHPNDFDGQPATMVHVHPTGLALDERGDLFISDQGTCSVRKVDRGTKVITTVAGGSGCGYEGDGGPATAATLGPPRGLDVSEGRLYIADTQNRRVRVVDGDGTIRTVAGNGSDGCPGDGVPAADAPLMYPYAVDAAGAILAFTDQGFFFGACSLGSVFLVGGGTLSRAAGNGTPFAGASGDPAGAINFWGIQAVAWGPDGRPYFGESRGIWTIDEDGRARLVAGGTNGDTDGAAAEARFRAITGLEFDDEGALWIADSGAGKIKRFSEGIVSTVAGGGPPATYGKDGPAGGVALAVSDLAPAADGSVFFTDSAGLLRVLRNDEVRTLGGVNENRALYPIGDGGPVGSAIFRSPRGIALASDGRIVLADRQHHRIRQVGADGRIETIAGDGGEASRGEGTLATLASFASPDDIALDPSGDLFITDAKNEETHQGADYVIRHVAPNGMVSRIAGTGTPGAAIGTGASLATPLENPLAIALGPGGLLVADHSTVRLIRPGAGGWPNPARSVRCDSYFPDQEGDGKVAQGFGYSDNQPSIDLLDGDVRTDGSTITVTMEVLDLNERTMIPPAAHYGTSWSWVYRFKVGDKYRYIGAFSATRSSATAAEPPGIIFEYGDSTLGRGASSYQLTRRGPATGTLDLAKDRITISAPLASVGLKPGDRVIYHEQHLGKMLEVGTFRSIGGSDGDSTFTPGYLPGSTRSFAVGTRCPEDY